MDPRQQPQPGNNPGVPVQQPEVYNSPTLNNVPYGTQPAPQPQSATPASFASGHNSRRGPVIAIVVGVVTALILIVAALFAVNSGSDSADRTLTTDDQVSVTQSIEPAQAIEIEQTNNSISQDLSGLDEEKDFPAAGLDDKTLGL